MIKLKIEYPDLTDEQLLIGYQEKYWIKYPIIANMKKTPHIFVSGLSNSGKTCMIEHAIKGKDVILVNIFRDDFKSIKTRRINGNDNILKFFEAIIKDIYYREKPLYIVMDELLVLCMDTKITKAIMELLAVGRHYNIYLIGICQLGTKENVKFKDLFNVRICFKQVEESSYRAVLGYSPEERDLKQRQFLFYSDQIGLGYTYDVG
jgi:DNA segregation ATPase FtsK/SpoIIIE-like protein